MNGVSTVLLLAFRGLRQHALTSFLAALLVALATGGFITTWTVRGEAQRAFTETAGAFDAVLGARGSPLQLVLSALFHLEASPGNVAWADVEALRAHPSVAHAIPIAVGDNYRGWRLVGAPLETFTEVEWLPNKRLSISAGGRLFDPAKREAIAGSFVARRLGLKVGDRVQAFHGLDFNADAAHDEFFEVVGVLEPTGTPADRVIWIPLTALQTMSGHDPRAATAVSAVLVQFKPGARAAGFQLNLLYNRQGDRLTFAWPVAAVVAGLFDRFIWFDRIFGIGAAAAGVLSALSVWIALQGSMSARRRDWAILRALGAARGLLLSAVVGEATLIGVAGSTAGLIVYVALGAFVADQMQVTTGVLLNVPGWHPVVAWGPAGMIALCALASLIPAWRAYRTSVAENLIPIS